MDNQNNVNSVIKTLSERYGCKSVTCSLEDDIKRLSQSYTVDVDSVTIKHTNKPKKVPAKPESREYQPTEVESLFITKNRRFDSLKELFPKEFRRDTYVKIIESIVGNLHLKSAYSIIAKLKITTDLSKKLNFFKEKYTQKAKTMPMSDGDTASEDFTKGFISMVGNSISNLLIASMRKLNANSKDLDYRNLTKSIVSFLNDVGFFVPYFDRDYQVGVASRIWDVSRIASVYNSDKSKHGIIYEVELFPYGVKYYDEYDDRFDKMLILGACNVYSINASR